MNVSLLVLLVGVIAAGWPGFWCAAVASACRAWYRHHRALIGGLFFSGLAGARRRWACWAALVVATLGAVILLVIVAQCSSRA